jgi:hypothetical protein
MIDRHVAVDRPEISPVHEVLEMVDHEAPVSLRVRPRSLRLIHSSLLFIVRCGSNEI